MDNKGFPELAEIINALVKQPWVKELVGEIREHKKREYQNLLNNCVDNDKAILYEREIEGLEEVKSDGE
jgi:hypothetical protein